MHLCLNMIVKNEAANLVRCFEAVLPHISSYVIVDTGSTDATPQITKTFFGKHGIPGEVHHVPFENFSQARNAALTAAVKSSLPWDYLLFTDADMELKAEPGAFDKLDAASYTVLQRQGTASYWNVRLLKRGVQAEYCCPTHEYLSVPDMKRLEGPWFHDHASGSNRGEKAERDERLLRAEIEKNPNSERAWFYLAQTLNDQGRKADARRMYQRRIELGGWDEEVYFSKFQAAHCAPDNVTFYDEMMSAYEYRASRAEPLYAMARRARDNSQHARAVVFAEAGLQMKRPDDILFVDDAPYSYGFEEELAICGYYVPGKRLLGEQLCDELSLRRDVPNQTAYGARRNQYFYLRTLEEHAPSFETHPLVWNEPGWSPSNPSVAVHKGRVYVNLRLVNYLIRDDGSYDLRGDSSVRTRNILRTYDMGLVFLREEEWARPMLNPQSTRIIGMEDVRLIPHGNELYGLACVLDRNPHEWCEQFIFSSTTHPRRIDPQFVPKSVEKNWMPILHTGLSDTVFLYRQGKVMGSHGKLLVDEQPRLNIDHFSGGSQLIAFDGGWIGVVHERDIRPGGTKRWYQHRFIWVDHEYRTQLISLPFVFHDKDIEFCAGLARVNDKFVLSYACNDHAAYLATVKVDEVRSMLR